MKLIKNIKVATLDGLVNREILFNENQILDIDEKIDLSIYADCNIGEIEIIEGKGYLAMPGLVDVHVHLREPGYEHKETLKSGTMAALAGGFTTVMAMPNVIPFPDNVETVKNYENLIEKNALINVKPYMCITIGEKGKDLVDFKALTDMGYIAFSDDGVGLQSDEVMEKAMIEAKKYGAIITAHTEDMRYREKYSCINEGERNKELGVIGIPNECEYKQLERDLKLVEKIGNSYHCCHMSAKESVDLLRKYKNKGCDVSGEVTAHHLLLTEANVNDSNEKMNPPLRKESDRKALIDGILDNTIEMIANDHAPHTEKEKSRGLISSPFGIVALETSFPLLYTHLVKTGVISLYRLIELMSTAPAKRFAFERKGRLEKYYDSDIVLVNLDEEFFIDKERFYSKGKNTPFNNWKCYGKIKKTFVAGQLRYEEE